MTTLGEVLEFLEEDADISRLAGDDVFALAGAGPLASSGEGMVSFLVARLPEPVAKVAAAAASLLIIDRAIALSDEEIARNPAIRAVARVDNARLAFIRVVAEFFTHKPVAGISPLAAIDASAVLGRNVSIGAMAVIGPDVVIGDNVVVHAQVVIKGPAVIGSNVTIHSGTVIGADGFGYERNEAGDFEKFPHVGGVQIGDNVEIGANTCIDKGTLGDTVIGDGSKIDNLVHIAHNVKVGRSCAIIAHCMVGGSTVIGDYSWVAPSSCLRDQLVIGRHATIGLGSVVTKAVADGDTVYGVPARTAEAHASSRDKPR